MIISLGNHIQLAMEAIGPVINSFTYPVFVNAENNRPDLIASSVAINLNNRTYLITASHVLDTVIFAKSPFYIALEGAFIQLEGEFIRSVKKPRDPFDIAFLELSAEMVVSNNIQVLSAESLMIRKNFKEVQLSLIHGYPCSKNNQFKALRRGTTFKSLAYSYGGKVDREFNNWQEYNKHQDFHICMNYGRGRGISGEITTPPTPRGISGGGLWLIPNLLSPHNVYLSGIFIEYHSAGKVSFSTKIEKVAKFIEDNA